MKSMFSHESDSYGSHGSSDEYERLLRGEISSAEYAQTIEDRLERAAEEHPLVRPTARG